MPLVSGMYTQMLIFDKDSSLNGNYYVNNATLNNNL